MTITQALILFGLGVALGLFIGACYGFNKGLKAGSVFTRGRTKTFSLGS